MKATAVREVMTTGVVAVREDADFKEMVIVMRRRRVSAFPVIDADGRVIGVVSEADLLLKEAAQAARPARATPSGHRTDTVKAAGVTAAEVMTAPPVTIGQDAPVADAARRMQSRRVKRLPVVDDRGRLRGIISRADVLSVFERPDADIWDDVVKDIIAGEFGLDPLMFDVTVRSGVVTVTGSVDRRADALDLLGALRHLEGVVALRDRLGYPDEE